MKKITSLLISCSLALAATALAQQPEEQASPGKKKQEKAHAAEATKSPGGARAEHAKSTGAMNERATAKGRNAKTNASPGAAETKVSPQASASATPGAVKQQQAEQERGKGMKRRAAAKTSPAASAAPTPASTAGAGAAPTPVTATGQQKTQAKPGVAAAKKPDPQQVQQIKSQHTNFKAQPKPEQVPAVTFNQSYRIQGAEQWQGPQYEVFRAYRPEWHDESWYRSRYGRVELIAGGYYYFNNGYWYPAWGYNPSASYYVYDAPIYVGHRAEPPDRVIADVQAALQQMGYYRGEVDGLIGPLTREALSAYQSDQGLVTTAVIDQPTLDSLGLS